MSGLVHSGCLNRPLTGQLINNRNVLLTVLEAGKSKPKLLDGSPFDEGPLPCSESCCSLGPPMVEWARELSGVSLIRD